MTKNTAAKAKRDTRRDLGRQQSGRQQSGRQEPTQQVSRREEAAPQLHRCYGAIGISAVAAALRYQSEVKNPAYAPVVHQRDKDPVDAAA